MDIIGRMRLKKCKRCGLVFETAQQGKYLCDTCNKAAKLNSVYRERLCIDCGTTFLGFPASQRCESCNASHKRELDRERRNRAARKIGSVDICIACGSRYIVAGGRQKYCPDCKAEQTGKNIREHKRDYQAAYIADPAHAAAKQASRRYNKVCVICGAVFDSRTPAVTCSLVCAAQRKRQCWAAAELKRGPRHNYTAARWANIKSDPQLLDDFRAAQRRRYHLKKGV